jgi:2-keto-4-pentenoate hydratase/2-oxohepta-3-ene-1,7-dioic acid hydratase in catechol pathway
MRIGTYLVDGEERLGLVAGDGAVDLLAASGGLACFRSLLDWLRAGPEALERTRELAASDARLPAGARLLAPLPRPPRNVICVGRNYQVHIDQGDAFFSGRKGRSKRPIFFTKAPETVIGPGVPIPAHAGLTRQLDYECELAAVVGLGGRDVPAEDAWRHIAGYTLLNDVTARDLQEEHGQWFKGKSLDGFCPMGPHLVTADEFGGYPEIALGLTVDGEVRQSLHTRDMIWTIPELVAELSAGFTLRPGDVIATGTGAGCAFSFDPPRFLRPGQVVELWAEGVGRLANPVGGSAAGAGGGRSD